MELHITLGRGNEVHGFAGLVKEFGFYPERLESRGSQQMAGWLAWSALHFRKPTHLHRVEAGAGQGRANLDKGPAGRLWKNPGIRKSDKNWKSECGEGEKKKKSTLFD